MWGDPRPECTESEIDITSAQSTENLHRTLTDDVETTPSGDLPVVDNHEDHPVGCNTDPKLAEATERQAGKCRRALPDRERIREWP